MPFCLLPFTFHDGKDILLEEFREILHVDANVYVIVYLYGNAYTVALSYTKASRKHYVILDLVLLDRLFEKLYDILRSLKMTGRAYAYLNYNHITVP